MRTSALKTRRSRFVRYSLNARQYSHTPYTALKPVSQGTRGSLNFRNRMKIEEVMIESKYNDFGRKARTLEMHVMEPNGPV